MMLVAFFGWWYKTGWMIAFHKVGARMQGVLLFFSVAELLGSFFAPFRQVSAGRVQGPLGDQLRAFGDRLMSRFVGVGVRTILIITGLAAAILYGVVGCAVLALWPLLPAFPFVGLLVTLVGYLP